MSQPSTRRSSQQGEVLTAQQQPASSSAGGGRDTSGFGHGALSPEEQYQKQAEFGSVDLAPDTFGRRRPPAFTTDSAAQQEQEVVSDVTTTRQPSFLEARVEPRPVNGASDSGGLFAAMRSASGGLGLGFGGLNRVTNSSSTAGDAGKLHGQQFVGLLKVYHVWAHLVALMLSSQLVEMLDERDEALSGWMVHVRTM